MATEKTITFNGKEMTQEEVQKALAELSQLTKLQKAAKQAGMVEAKKPAEPKPAEFELLKANLTPIIEQNLDLIKKLFVDFAGQDSVSIAINKQYSVIIRDTEITKEKQKKNKEAKAKAEKEAKAKEGVKVEVPTDPSKPVDIENL
jgi:hypothetical protein